MGVLECEWSGNGGLYLKKSNTGQNFGRLASADEDGGRPGDFAKIIWKNKGDVAVGAVSAGNGSKGEGHAVVFLGCEVDSQGKATQFCTWGSNTGQGIGVRCYPKDDIGLTVYSRPNGKIPDPRALDREASLVELGTKTKNGTTEAKNHGEIYLEPITAPQ